MMESMRLREGRETAPYRPLTHCKTTKLRKTDGFSDNFNRAKPEKPFYNQCLTPDIQQPIDRLENRRHIDGVYPTPKPRPVSLALSHRQADALVLSWMFAKAQGFGLNRLITISFASINLKEPIQKFTLALFGYLWSWQRRHYGKSAYVWVVEVGEVLGLHIHIAVYANDDPALSYDLQAWLKARIGWRGNLPRGTFHSAPILDDGLLRYFLKGANPEAQRRIQKSFGLSISLTAQGEIHSKRWGRSRSLGPKAQRRAGFSAPQARLLITGHVPQNYSLIPHAPNRPRRMRK